MLSLPLIAPQNEYTLFLSPHLRPPSPPTHPSQTHTQPQTRRQPQPHLRSSLAQLQSDELAITTRKHNIRRFGAAWIKPPGVTKTLQAEIEERAEREEQEGIQRREQMMMDLQARQEVEEARVRAAAEAEEGAEGEEGERDLDDEIPDADEVEDEDEDTEGMEAENSVEEAEEASYGDVTSSEEDEDDEDEEVEVEEIGNQSFNEESLLENSFMPGDEEVERLEQERYARLEEAELTGVAREREDLGMDVEAAERDLDDSVPEAGEYQHTDSELEDTFSDEGEESLVERSGGEGSLQVRELQGRSSFGRDVSSLLESSFVDSSPVLGRLRSATHRANQR